MRLIVGSLTNPSGLGRCHGHVADAADGLDHRLVLGAELGAQSPHVDVDRADAAVAVIAPHLVHEPGTAERPTGVLHQEVQQFELGQRQTQILAVQRRRVAGRVQDEVAELKGAAEALRRRVIAKRNRVCSSAAPAAASSTSSKCQSTSTSTKSAGATTATTATAGASAVSRRHALRAADQVGARVDDRDVGAVVAQMVVVAQRCVPNRLRE